MKSADLEIKISIFSYSSYCLDLKLGTYLYCDILNPVNSLICSLKSVFADFGAPTCLQHTKISTRTWAADVCFQVKLSAFLMEYYLVFRTYVNYNAP